MEHQDRLKMIQPHDSHEINTIVHFWRIIGVTQSNKIMNELCKNCILALFTTLYITE